MGVENIKKLFDAHDPDSSGYIDYPEYCHLLFKLLGGESKYAAALPENRKRAFWREIDTDGDGKVFFNELLAWYITHCDGSGPSPLEEYYESLRPVPNTRGLTERARF